MARLILISYSSYYYHSHDNMGRECQNGFSPRSEVPDSATIGTTDLNPYHDMHDIAKPPSDGPLLSVLDVEEFYNMN